MEEHAQSDLKLTVETSLIERWKVRGRERTVEERIQRLEEAVGALITRDIETREEVQTYINQKVSEVEKASVGRDEKLRRFLADRLQGERRQRYTGVALFIAGAALSALANVVGALA